MELNVDRFAAQLAGEPLRPAYLVAGSETLLVLEAADAVRAAARAQGIDEREVHDMEGRDADWDALDAAINAPSLFASRRLIEIRLPTGKPGTEGAKLIAGLCASPPSDVVVLVVAGDWSRSHGGKWSEAITRAGHACIAWPIKPHELTGWIGQRLRSRGVKAAPDAVAAAGSSGSRATCWRRRRKSTSSRCCWIAMPARPRCWTWRRWMLGLVADSARVTTCSASPMPR
jgi:DNA polymerase-3 subunit delta